MPIGLRALLSRGKPGSYSWAFWAARGVICTSPGTTEAFAALYKERVRTEDEGRAHAHSSDGN